MMPPLKKSINCDLQLSGDTFKYDVAYTSIIHSLSWTEKILNRPVATPGYPILLCLGGGYPLLRISTAISLPDVDVFQACHRFAKASTSIWLGQDQH